MIAALVSMGVLTAQSKVPFALIGDRLAVAYSDALRTDLGDRYQLECYTSIAPTLTPKETEKLTAQAPAAVVVQFGTELAASVNWCGERDKFVPKLEALLEQLQGLSFHPRVFLAVPPPAGLSQGLEMRRRISDEVIPLVKQAARESQCAVIDMPEAISDRLDLMDGLYPSAVGGELLAEAVDEVAATGRKQDWKLMYADSEEKDEGPARNAIDGDPETYWHTNYSTSQEKYPHEIQVDTGSERVIGGFSYLPRQDGVNGRVAKFEFYVSQDGKTWGSPVAKGKFKKGGDLSKIYFAQPVTARYFRFVALSEQDGQIWASAAEIDLLKFYPKRP